MYTIKKRFEIAGSHKLDLSYQSKCQNVHGHNWIITVICKSDSLNGDGMVTDFSIIKKEISDAIDHKHLNDVLPFNPTAENIARWICETIPNAVSVTVQESEGNEARYDNF